MSQWGSPARGFHAPASFGAAGRAERRWLLLWRGFVSVLALAAYSIAGVVRAVLALAQIAGRPIAGRRIGVLERRQSGTGPGRQALPG